MLIFVLVLVLLFCRRCTLLDRCYSFFSLSPAIGIGQCWINNDTRSRYVTTTAMLLLLLLIVFWASSIPTLLFFHFVGGSQPMSLLEVCGKRVEKEKRTYKNCRMSESIHQNNNNRITLVTLSNNDCLSERSRSRPIISVTTSCYHDCWRFNCLRYRKFLSFPHIHDRCNWTGLDLTLTVP